MTIDIEQVEYDVELLTEKGERYLLNDALLSLSWEEQISELAQTATFSAANMAIGSTWLSGLAKIPCVITIYGKWGEGRKVLFEGKIWECEYTSADLRQFAITAYDNMKYLQASDDYKYFQAGMTTKAIITEICGDWGIPLDYKWSEGITHEKKVFKDGTVADMIISLLEEVRKKTGKKYAAYFRDSKFQVVGYGTNDIIYKFDNDITISTQNKQSMSELITRVKIIGTAADDARAPVDAVVNGKTEFGILQKVIIRDSTKTIKDAKAEADTLIKEKGKPTETSMISAPDIPFMRKGDKIDVAAGNLVGKFYVEGISHNAQSKTMTLTIARA